MSLVYLFVRLLSFFKSDQSSFLDFGCVIFIKFPVLSLFFVRSPNFFLSLVCYWD